MIYVSKPAVHMCLSKSHLCMSDLFFVATNAQHINLLCQNVRTDSSAISLSLLQVDEQVPSVLCSDSCPTHHPECSHKLEYPIPLLDTSNSTCNSSKQCFKCCTSQSRLRRGSPAVPWKVLLHLWRCRHHLQVKGEAAHIAALPALQHTVNRLSTSE